MRQSVFLFSSKSTFIESEKVQELGTQLRAVSTPAANGMATTTSTLGMDDALFDPTPPDDLSSSTESLAEFALQLQRSLATLYMIGAALLVFFLQHGLLKRHHAHLWAQVGCMLSTHSFDTSVVRALRRAGCLCCSRARYSRRSRQKIVTHPST